MKPSTKRMIEVLAGAFVYIFMSVIIDVLFDLTTPISFFESLLFGYVMAWCRMADEEIV